MEINKAPRGTQDVLPAESDKWQYVERTALAIARDYGYREMRTPVFEHTELFLRGVGETTDVVQKEMYTFTDKGGRSLTLRPELTAAQREEKVRQALLDVGLLPEFASRFPHEFSGGQRQRIGIARALIVEPEFIVADEPISALDMSIRAQVLNLLRQLQKQRGITYLFIAHDLSVMRYISDCIAVIRKGNIVELADAEELVTHPLHPYTRSLLSAIPMPDPRREREKKLLVYDPAMHDYTAAPPVWRELRPRHWVLCNDAEAERWLTESGTI